MKKQNFVHLHNHSEYSLFDGLLRFGDNCGRPSAFMLELAEQKGAAMAITDHGNMYGAMEFYFTAEKLGIKPIIGCEVYVQRTPIADRTEGSHKGAGHLVLLASDNDGYSNLCRIVSRSFMEGFNHGPKVDLDLLDKHRKGLICLSGCISGQIARACSQGRTEDALAAAKKHIEIFGKANFYLELMDNGLPEQAAAMKGLLELAKKLRLPVVATNDCHYWKKEDWEIQDAKLCLNTRSFIDDPKRFRFTGHEYYFKSPEEMAKLFKHVPEALKNTLAIAGRCNVKIAADKPRLPEFTAKGGADACLKALCLKTAGKPAPEYKRRLEYELKEIKTAGLAPFFLIAADIVKLARAQGVPVGPGRGSSAGSLINYLLGVTRVDPLAYGLLFERFLTGDSPLPGLDIELGEAGREKVLDALRKKYGAGSVARIISFGVKHQKGLVWDLGTALGMAKEEVARLANLVSSGYFERQSIAALPAAGELLKEPQFKRLARFADALSGIRAHTGVHPAGVLITPGPAAASVPLSTVNNKNAVTAQYESHFLSRLGFMRLDLSAQRALDVNQAAAGRVKTRGFDLDKIPLEDMKTWTLVSHGLTTGVFQLEGEGIKKMLVELRPSSLEDLSVCIAFTRSGTVQSGLAELYLAAKVGAKRTAPPLPEAALLKETCGVAVFQEQVMRVATELAGFSPRQANELRRVLGKKREPETAELRKKFIAGAAKKKITFRAAGELYDRLARVAGGGFNKAHSVAYALLAYRQAYLKVNYPAEFMMALLESEKARGAEYDHYRYSQYLAEAQRIGVKI